MKRVVLGMSGGVDSSASAAILKDRGYEVVGITFIFTEDADPTDAIKVSEMLGIEHHVLDYRKEFKELIIDSFLNDYKSGITPNPCVRCNKTVKIKFLYEAMKKFNADYISTGHYAKIGEEGLFVSSDRNKDQTYFLCQVPKEILDKLILPLEGITKPEVRKIAEEAGLLVAHKKDSTDVCFITSNFKEYMNTVISNNPGDVIDIKTKEVIGKHKGLSFYTIGQRRGLDIGGTKDRMFVVGKDIDKNILYICTGDNNDYLYSNSCLVEGFNYLKEEKIYECSARFRYRQELTPVTVEYLDDDKALVKYPSGVKAVTKGQACVLYDGDECLGGGIIKEIYKDGEEIWYQK